MASLALVYNKSHLRHSSKLSSPQVQLLQRFQSTSNLDLPNSEIAYELKLETSNSPILQEFSVHLGLGMTVVVIEYKRRRGAQC